MTRFSNEVRYRTNEHPNQRQLTPGYVLIPVRHALGGEICPESHVIATYKPEDWAHSSAEANMHVAVTCYGNF